MTKQERELLALVAELEPNAYGVPIYERLNQGKPIWALVSYFGMYMMLGRLQDAGLLGSWDGDATPERGGRKKRFWLLTEQGREALNDAG